MNLGIKVAYIKSQIYFVYKSIKCTQLSQNDKNCEQYQTKCCVEIAATLTLATIDVFLIKMCQECYNS